MTTYIAMLRWIAQFLRRPLSVVAGLALICSYSGKVMLAQNVGFAFTQTKVASVPIPAGMAVDASGNIFAADQNGVVEILAAGGYTTVRQLGTGFYLPACVSLDSEENVFVADQGNNAVKEILASGNYATVKTLGSGFFSPSGVAVDSNDNVFVADLGNNEVKEILASGGYKTVKRLGDSFAFSQPEAVALDSSGNVFVGDTGNQVIEELPAASGYTIVNQLGYSVTVQPSQIAVDGSGNLFLANCCGSQSGIEEVVAASGYEVVEVVTTSVGEPAGIAIARNGDILASDALNNAIDKIQTTAVNFGSINVCGRGQQTPAPCSETLSLVYDVTASGIVAAKETFDGSPNPDFQPASGGTCGNVTAGTTCTVNVTFTPTEPGLRQGAVTLENAGGTILATTNIYGTGTGPAIAFSPVTFATQENYSEPTGVAVDLTGDVYVADNEGSQIAKLTKSGQLIQFIGTGISVPAGVAVDGAANIFVTDAGQSAVKEILSAGGYTTINVLGGGFSFIQPHGVAVDGGGNLFVTDTFLGGLYEIPAAGGYSSVVTLADGLAEPQGVAVDGNDNVFVAEFSSGVKEFVASTGYKQPVSIARALTKPTGVAVDASGNLYVSDAASGAVYEVTAPGGYANIITLHTTPEMTPTGVAVDSVGDVFFVDDFFFSSPDGSFSDYIGSLGEIFRSQPPAISFATTQVGSVSADSPKSVTVENIGNAPLDLTSLSIGANFMRETGSGTPADCEAGSSVESGASCNLSIAFDPGAIGSIQSSVVLKDNALNHSTATQSVPLSGTGVPTPGQLSVSNTITAPTIPVGSNEIVSVTVSNIGGSPLTFTASVVGPNFVLLTTAANTCMGTLPAGQSCTLPLSFQPPGVGLHSASLNLTPSSGTAVVAKLSGLAAGVGDLSESALNFGSIPVGTLKALTLTIENFGVSGSPTFTATPNNSNYSVTGGNCLSMSLSAGQQCMLTVQFAPTGVGVEDAALVIKPTTGPSTTVKLLGAAIAAAQ